MADRYPIEVKVCDTAQEVYRDADILAALTDSAVSVLDGAHIPTGAHIVAPGTGRIASPNGASFGAAVLACLKDSRGVNQQTTRSHAECFPWQTTSSVLLELLSGLSSVSRVATLTG
jgi:hypothetical protein